MFVAPLWQPNGYDENPQETTRNGPMTATMTHHCKYCGQDKPESEMRRDSRYPTGFRPQCLDCKSKAEGRTRRKSAPPTKKSSSSGKSGKGLPAEKRLYSCTACKRDDIPFSDMMKDKRKFMGVASQCLPCRRSKEAARTAEKLRLQQEEEAKKALLLKAVGDEWEYCFKCNQKARPGTLTQPPSTVAAGFPDGVKVCAKCVQHLTNREDIIRAERARHNIPPNATRKQLESAARVAALRELAQIHASDYRMLLRRYMDSLGVESEKKWVTL